MPPKPKKVMYYGFDAVTKQFFEVSSDNPHNVTKHAAQVRSWQEAKRTYYSARIKGPNALEDSFACVDEKLEANFDTILQRLISSPEIANCKEETRKWLNQLMAYDFARTIDLGDHFMKVMLALSHYVKWLPMGSANSPTSYPRAIINGLCDTALYIVAMQFPATRSFVFLVLSVLFVC